MNCATLRHEGREPGLHVPLITKGTHPTGAPPSGPASTMRHLLQDDSRNICARALLVVLHVLPSGDHRHGSECQTIEKTGHCTAGDVSIGRIVPNYVPTELVAGAQGAGAQGATSRLGTCNRTHHVCYVLASSLPQSERYSSAAVHVHLVMPGNNERLIKAGTVPLPPHDRGVHLLALSDTPPPHVDITGADGFVGLSGYSVKSGSRGVISVPPHQPLIAQQAARELLFEPKRRRTIGVWSNNCAPAHRRRIVDQLLGSGLRVESYGRCRHNMNATERWARARITDGDSEALRACRQHRLMLADESNHCPGYITMNLANAFSVCGAIPIIHQTAGLPDYYAELGYFPNVNASERGWLREAQRLMENDTHYHALLETGWRQQSTHEAAPGRAFGGAHFHCQWHDARLQELPRRRVELEQCAFCRDHTGRSEDVPDSGLNRKRLVVACNTTSAWAWGAVDDHIQHGDDHAGALNEYEAAYEVPVADPEAATVSESEATPEGSVAPEAEAPPEAEAVPEGDEDIAFSMGPLPPPPQPPVLLPRTAVGHDHHGSQARMSDNTPPRCITQKNEFHPDCAYEINPPFDRIQRWCVDVANPSLWNMSRKEVVVFAFIGTERGDNFHPFHDGMRLWWVLEFALQHEDVTVFHGDPTTWRYPGPIGQSLLAALHEHGVRPAEAGSSRVELRLDGQSASPFNSEHLAWSHANHAVRAQMHAACRILNRSSDAGREAWVDGWGRGMNGEGASHARVILLNRPQGSRNLLIAGSVQDLLPITVSDDACETAHAWNLPADAYLTPHGAHLNNRFLMAQRPRLPCLIEVFQQDWVVGTYALGYLAQRHVQVMGEQVWDAHAGMYTEQQLKVMSLPGGAACLRHTTDEDVLSCQDQHRNKPIHITNRTIEVALELCSRAIEPTRCKGASVDPLRPGGVGSNQGGDGASAAWTWTCAVPTCNTKVLASHAGGHTCGARMDWLQSPKGGSRSPHDACKQVANEFPTECGACRPRAPTEGLPNEGCSGWLAQAFSVLGGVGC